MAQSIDQLKSAFRGELIQAEHPAYESARKVYNGMIDKRPHLIAQCLDVADVIAAVNFGRENNLLTAIRGGGHNGGGLGTCDDGLVIDLSRMKGIRVNPDERTVRVGAGCVWGDVDHVASSPQPVLPGSPWAEALATLLASTVSPSTICFPLTWCWPTENS